jgi:altronate dehydratase small subunit
MRGREGRCSIVAHAIALSEKDNTATALSDLQAGLRPVINGPTRFQGIELKDEIPFGHKFALVPIGLGEEVVKYGEVIGIASKSIDAGEYVHVHNVVSRRGRGDLEVSEA